MGRPAALSPLTLSARRPGIPRWVSTPGVGSLRSLCPRSCGTQPSCPVTQSFGNTLLKPVCAACEGSDIARCIWAGSLAGTVSPVPQLWL